MSKRKAYRPRAPGSALLKTQPWRLNAVFSPLESIIAQLEQHGTCDVAQDGTPIFLDAIDGCWYDTCVALDGVSEAFELHTERSGQSLNMRPLRQLSNKLRAGMMIFESDTAALKESLHAARSACMGMTIDYASDLIKTIRIREEMDRIQSEAA